MKNILVPYDFSEPAKAAYHTALAMAKQSGGKVILLHVLYIPTLYSGSLAGDSAPFDPVYFTTMEEDARRELEKLKANTGGIEVGIEVTFGDIVSSIKRLTETHLITLILMGRTGTSGFTEVFIGSNTEKVVRHATVPVLAIRKELDIPGVKKILLPSTLELDQVNYMKRVKELQEFFNATLHVLLINTPTSFRRDAEAEEALQEFVKHYQLKNYKTYFRNYWNEEDGIADFAQIENIDLIAMGTRGLKGLAHLALGSTTEDVVNQISLPIWTCKLRSS